ncbi:MAG: hypothetical protein RL398_1102 [Planctomycetota bacterium]|jgi:hypothetical protein
MSTPNDSNPVSGSAPQVPGSAPQGGTPTDIHIETGIYAWFRKHQKKLLYSAGLFTLLTFSVTGPMLSAFDSLFGVSQSLPTLQVNGKKVSMQPEDYQFGEQLARNPFAFSLVLPGLGVGDGGQTELSDSLAILRRVAVELGLEVSMVEVDKAIEVMRAQSQVQSVAQFAQQRGMSSLAQYRNLMREAMRIGNYVRLSTLALDNSDARVLAKVIEDKEKITLRVATFDEKALEDSLKAAGGIDDDGLRKWLDGKTQNEKQMLQVFDSNRVALRIGAAMLDAFDAAQWQEDGLKDFTIGDETLKKVYDQEKATRFKTDKEGEFKPLEDEAVKAEVTKLLQAEQVMQTLLGKLRERMNESMKDINEELRKANDEFFQAQNNLNIGKQKLEQKPDDAAAKEEIRLAEEVLPAKEAAKKAAEEAAKAARAQFDFKAAFAELTKDKAGFVLKEFADRRNAEALKDLDAGELGLGQFPNSVMATFLRDVGALSNMPGRTTKAVILYQVADVEVQPLKPWEQLKPLLEGAYFTEKAKTEAEAKKKTLEEALLRLAKAKMTEKVAELEGKRAADVDKKLADWETKINEGIAEAQKTLAKAKDGTEAQRAWRAKLDRLQADLAGKDAKRKEFDDQTAKEIEASIAKEAKKFYAEVMAEAAKEAGFTVAEFGPFSRELAQRPRFDKSFDPTVVFLWQNHSDLEVGDATDVLADKTNRRWHVAACLAEAPLTAADVTRREFEGLRSSFGFSFADQQAFEAFQQAFTKEALETRFGYESAVGQQEVPAPAGK